MNKQQLISNLSRQLKTSKSKALRFIDTFVEEIEKALKKGQKVQLVGFGSFRKKRRRARNGRNPQNGKPVRIPARNVVSFSPGQHLSDLIN